MQHIGFFLCLRVLWLGEIVNIGDNYLLYEGQKGKVVYLIGEANSLIQDRLLSFSSG